MSPRHVNRGRLIQPEHFHPTITQVSDGSIYMVVGHEQSSIVKLEGLETVRRRAFGSVEIRKEPIAGQPEISIERARRQAREALEVASRAHGPVVDGRLDDWPSDTQWADIGGRAKAAVTLAGGRLYAAFRTGDDAALNNSGGDYRYLFKTGGALDLMIGTDPGSPKDRQAAVEGDIRLLVTHTQGRSRAVLFRPVATRGPRLRRCCINLRWARRDSMRSRMSAIGSRLPGARATSSFPYRWKSWVSAGESAELLGDLGLLRGDGAPDDGANLLE